MSGLGFDWFSACVMAEARALIFVDHAEGRFGLEPFGSRLSSGVTRTWEKGWAEVRLRDTKWEGR